jgi:hypothetical protein
MRQLCRWPGPAGLGPWLPERAGRLRLCPVRGGSCQHAGHAGAGPPAEVSGPAAKTYLGAVTGTDALIGVAAEGAHVRAYLYDGTPGRAVTLADWLTGPVHGGPLDAVSGQYRVHLVVRLGGTGATGTITLADCTVFWFTAPLAAGGPGCSRAPGGCAGSAITPAGSCSPMATNAGPPPPHLARQGTGHRLIPAGPH